MVSNPGADGPAQATQAALEAETNEDTYAAPDLIKASPGVTKGYCRITAAGALVANSYNVSSITDTAVGDRLINWNVDFANANFSVVTSTADNNFTWNLNDNFLAASNRVQVFNTALALTDRATSTVACGDQ